MYRHLPNILTVFRILLVPVLVIALIWTDQVGAGNPAAIAAVFIFMVAVTTDWLDGALARRWNLTSRFGKLGDPLADKLLNVSALIMFVQLEWLPGWLVFLIIAREMSVNTLRMLAALEDVTLSAGPGGKIKTITQFGGIYVLFLHGAWPDVVALIGGQVMIYASVVFAWTSAAQYFAGYFRAENGGA